MKTKLVVDYYYVAVSYPADWYFDIEFPRNGNVDDWILKQFKGYGIEESGSGMGFGCRDFGGTTTEYERAMACKQDLECYPKIKVKIYINSARPPV